MGLSACASLSIFVSTRQQAIYIPTQAHRLSLRILALVRLPIRSNSQQQNGPDPLLFLLRMDLDGRTNGAGIRNHSKMPLPIRDPVFLLGIPGLQSHLPTLRESLFHCGHQSRREGHGEYRKRIGDAGIYSHAGRVHGPLSRCLFALAILLE